MVSVCPGYQKCLATLPSILIKNYSENQSGTLDDKKEKEIKSTLSKKFPPPTHIHILYLP